MITYGEHTRLMAFNWRIFSKISLALAVLARFLVLMPLQLLQFLPSAPTTMAKDLYCRLICPC